MSDQNSIQEIFFKYLSQLSFDASAMDLSLIEKHKERLKVLSEVSNSGIHVFDVYQKQIVYFSNNFGRTLGYDPSDYQDLNYQFFDALIHPEEKHKLAVFGLSAFKMFNAFTSEEKLSHKVVYEYRMKNAENNYVRLVEQYQILELDPSGQVWLLMSIVDVSPNQEPEAPVKCQLLNFKTGQFIPMDVESKTDLELTKRELEILRLVRQGLLSKEISDKLSISVHTVNTHRQRFLEKLGANNSFEAVAFASRFGLLD